MTAFRLMSLPTHGAAETLLGLVLMGAPFVLGFSTAAIATTLVIGALVVGLGLAAATAGLATLDISAHTAYDTGIVLGLVGAAVVVAAAGDGIAAVFLLGAALVQLALNATTRYSAR
jgi:hypothetical protein